jgi:bifunctional enzyme CysN/CysC
VTELTTFRDSLREAAPPQSPVVRLAAQIDIGRGDMLVDPAAPPAVAREFAATLIWMTAEPLRNDTPYLLKHTTRQVCAHVRAVRHVVDIAAMKPVPGPAELRLNDIAEVEIETHQPLYFDPYSENRATGSFILIDMVSNRTVAAGMILPAAGSEEQPSAHATPGHPGLTVWFTGLSGAGKTTICEAVHRNLAARGYKVESLDGDVVRRHLSKGLGYSREDRNENIRRIGFVAELLTRNGVVVLVAAISPYREIREEVRAMVGDFVEVFVNAPLAVCERRDPKGLYVKARAGQLPAFTGIDDPYEPPVSPEVECRTDRETVEQSAARVMAAIERAMGLREPA